MVYMMWRKGSLVFFSLFMRETTWLEHFLEDKKKCH